MSKERPWAPPLVLAILAAFLMYAIYELWVIPSVKEKAGVYIAAEMRRMRSWMRGKGVIGMGKTNTPMIADTTTVLKTVNSRAITTVTMKDTTKDTNGDMMMAMIGGMKKVTQKDTMTHRTKCK